MANQAIAGTVYVRVDGKTLSVRGNVKAAMRNKQRESVPGVDGRIHGFKETTVAPYVELDVSDGQEVDWDALHDASGAEVQVELTTGKVGVLLGASQVNQGEVDGVEGQSTLRFEGTDGEWQ